MNFYVLMNLFLQAEFMEHDEKPLPIDIRLLGALAEKVCSNKHSAKNQYASFTFVFSMRFNCVFHASYFFLLHISVVHSRRLCITKKWNLKVHAPTGWMQTPLLSLKLLYI